ncbi:hypothetical protein BKM07_03030 [Pseudomonas syringae group genomosp. 3]|uniref:Uncharacterized protein n=1 Tax=Pseudomonas syringae group genomosp. 3 TaxID=251701 RepID=A0ABD6VHS2_9PSED|nr:hypothetical protein BKM07_03030 [Pseudomonas syringae group genomosp. 3]
MPFYICIFSRFRRKNHQHPQPHAILGNIKYDLGPVLLCNCFDNRKPQPATRTGLIVASIESLKHPLTFRRIYSWAVVADLKHDTLLGITYCQINLCVSTRVTNSVVDQVIEQDTKCIGIPRDD